MLVYRLVKNCTNFDISNIRNFILDIFFAHLFKRWCSVYRHNSLKIFRFEDIISLEYFFYNISDEFNLTTIFTSFSTQEIGNYFML